MSDEQIPGTPTTTTIPGDADDGGGLGKPCERCADCEPEAVEDQPLAVTVMQGRKGPRYMCEQCAADWRAYDAQEAAAEAVATALEAVRETVGKAIDAILETSYEERVGIEVLGISPLTPVDARPDRRRRFDSGGSLHYITGAAVTTADLCDAAILELETALACCDRAAVDGDGTFRERVQGVGDRRYR